MGCRLETLGIKDHLQVLSCMLTKIAINLRVYRACQDVIDPTLALFQVWLAATDWRCCLHACTLHIAKMHTCRRAESRLRVGRCNLFRRCHCVRCVRRFACVRLKRRTNACVCAQELATGYMSGKLLLKLDACTYVLLNHSPTHFPFLGDAAHARNRTTFYLTLARLLFMEDSPQRFHQFVAPLQQASSAHCWPRHMLWPLVVLCQTPHSHIPSPVTTNRPPCRRRWFVDGGNLRILAFLQVVVSLGVRLLPVSDGGITRCFRMAQVFVGLANASQNATSSTALRASVPKETVIGLFRDLRGIATATSSRRTYGPQKSPAHVCPCLLHAYSLPSAGQRMPYSKGIKCLFGQ